MIEENDANLCGIKKVFGLEFVMSKLVSCKVHFKNDVHGF